MNAADPHLDISGHRIKAMVIKEFIQLTRDRASFAMIILMPLMQLLLFGYAINNDPKHLPAAIHDADNGVYARSVEAALRNSGYFEFVQTARTPAEATELLNRGDVAFAITIPADPAKLAAVRELVAKFRDQVSFLLGAEPGREVYKLSVQFYPVTTPEDA